MKMSRSITEEIRVTGNKLVDAVKQIIREGNARRLVIKTAKGKTLLDTNLNLGAAGLGGMFYMAPIISAVTMLVMFATDFKIQVEREVNSDEEAEVIDVDEDEE